MKESNRDQKQYEAPSIVYEGKITTRAGSPVGDPNQGVDPNDLFGSGS